MAMIGKRRPALPSHDGGVATKAAVDGFADPDDPIDGVARCCCCGRFPVLGEQIIHHRGRKRDGWVCASCEADGRGDRLGPIIERARVRSLGGAMNVRRIG